MLAYNSCHHSIREMDWVLLRIDRITYDEVCACSCAVHHSACGQSAQRGQREQMHGLNKSAEVHMATSAASAI